ncbi:ABC transporter ATP-binding protein [Rhabdaerophilum calidifontis]|uniref:ABC transporter ATP-binding protein n=1 Tax=Rhabdaerophilum calidifontis TaxID=2604328 RepID=UPI001239FA66|nr:ABC transporter ATP-binding protein [Rhabdaerophilum calidifontis]
MIIVENLSIRLGELEIVRGLSFTLAPGEVLGLVGESGSGKSMTALAVLGLLPPGMRASGSIRFEGQDLLRLSERELRAVRGRRIGMVFQEPMTALNPVMTIGAQIAEGVIRHGLADAAGASKRALRLIARVGLPDPAARLHAYPHELSGGQRQRALIALAIACRPALLVADEPTSALDVTVQAELLALLREIRDETGMAMLFITHDLAVVSRLADRTLVLYGGRAMETGATRALLAAPRHPYTHGLLAAIPRGNAHANPLRPMPGQVPELDRLPPGCPFFGRCPKGDALCRDVPPPPVPGASIAWCHRPEAAP